jgi:hypothetical protein
MSSLILTPDSISLSDISYPFSPTYSTVTTTLSPNEPVFSPNTTSYTLKTTVSPTQTTLSSLSQLSPFTTDTVLTTSVVRGDISLLAVRPTVYVDIDTGLNDSYIVQKDVTKYFMYKTLDKWIYTEFPSVLKYLTYKDGKVALIKKIEDKESNSVSKDSEKTLEAKSDFIEKHILSESKTRAVLIRIMGELRLKWFELPYREDLVKDVMERYLKKKLKKMVLGDKSD